MVRDRDRARAFSPETPCARFLVEIFPTRFSLATPFSIAISSIFVARGLWAPRRDCFQESPARLSTGLRRAQPRSDDAGWVGRMANPFQFLQEVRSEAGKIAWPSRRETLITTGLVVLMVLFASLFFVLVDWSLKFGVGLLLQVGK
jgi:preprotein translocase subunit SecE